MRDALHLKALTSLILKHYIHGQFNTHTHNIIPPLNIFNKVFTFANCLRQVMMKSVRLCFKLWFYLSLYLLKYLQAFFFSSHFIYSFYIYTSSFLLPYIPSFSFPIPSLTYISFVSFSPTIIPPIIAQKNSHIQQTKINKTKLPHF